VPDCDFARWARKRATVAALFALTALPLAARAETLTCDTPLDLVRLAQPLSHLAQKIAAGTPITIVAIGSSSTAGTGASSPAATYPSRLEAELKQRFAGHQITVINRGAGGEEVADMLKRFDAALTAKPDLVLWQLGTNSVIRDHTFADHGDAIRAGIAKIRATGADVVLIDPQFVPKVIAKATEAEQMVRLIAVTAKSENVDLFRRFDVMKRWHDADHMRFESFVSSDGLHMNDWSYACMAKGLTIAITDAVERPVMSAAVMSAFVP
jgi:lysophospholipase L1-like esterase